MPRYLLRATLTHPTFRIPNLLSTAQLYGFDLKLISADLSRGALVVELEKEEHVQHILDRAIAVFWAAEIFAQADNMDQLHQRLKEVYPSLEPYRHLPFRISVDAANLHLTSNYQRSIASSFDYLDIQGKVNLTNPDVEYLIFEDYDWTSTTTKEEQIARQGNFEQVYFTRRIGHSRCRPMVSVNSVKTREYYGNTSMESEMGFLMACQTLAAPGRVVYDPFVGTGSLLYACAQLGAMVIGSDIDGRQMRGKKTGKGVQPGILRAAAQYGVEHHFMGCLTFDATLNPWRRGGWLDAIITDPPYGVRAGAKRLGKRPEKMRPMRDEPFQREDGTFPHLQPDYLPPSRPYELMHLTLDLIRFARYMLVPGGRLVFFLPTVTEEYDAIDVPVIEGMKELKWKDGSVQEYNKWGRRLITMEKVAQDDGPPPRFDDYSELEGKTAGHHQFNRKYFDGFKAKE